MVTLRSVLNRCFLICLHCISHNVTSRKASNLLWKIRDLPLRTRIEERSFFSLLIHAINYMNVRFRQRSCEERAFRFQVFVIFFLWFMKFFVLGGLTLICSVTGEFKKTDHRSFWACFLRQWYLAQKIIRICFKIKHFYSFFVTYYWIINENFQNSRSDHKLHHANGVYVIASLFLMSGKRCDPGNRVGRSARCRVYVTIECWYFP